MSTTLITILLIIVAILAFFAGFLYGIRGTHQQVRKARQEAYETFVINRKHFTRI